MDGRVALGRRQAGSSADAGAIRAGLSKLDAPPSLLAGHPASLSPPRLRAYAGYAPSPPRLPRPRRAHLSLTRGLRPPHRVLRRDSKPLRVRGRRRPWQLRQLRQRAVPCHEKECSEKEKNATKKKNNVTKKKKNATKKTKNATK